MIFPMVEKIRTWMARRLAPRAMLDVDSRVDMRVAATLASMDPLQLLMREYSIVFTDDFTRPEDGLDAKGDLMMKTWAYQTRDDPSFGFFCDWIMNSYGNEMLKRTPISEKSMIYARAQVSGIIQFRKEVSRLAMLYEEMLARRRGELAGDN